VVRTGNARDDYPGLDELAEQLAPGGDELMCRKIESVGVRGPGAAGGIRDLSDDIGQLHRQARVFDGMKQVTSRVGRLATGKSKTVVTVRYLSIVSHSPVID
jgi:phage FluMu protein gp41